MFENSLKIENCKLKIICIMMLLFLLFFNIPINVVNADDAVLPTVDQVEATALTISPSIFEGVVTQGKTSSQVFQLKNNSGVPLPIKCYIRNFDASDEEGGVAIPEEADTTRYSPRSWISIASPDFILQPQTSHEVTIKFNPPKDLPPGGYYGILFAEPLLPESFLDVSSLQVGGRLGSLLFLVSPGDINEKGKIASVNFPRFVFSRPAPDFNIRFENQGNVHLRPAGKITLTNRLTKKSQTVEVPEFTTLPGKTRQQRIKLNVVWPGLYRSDLELKYGQDHKILRSTSQFYYLPTTSILLAGAVLLLLLAAVIPKSRQRLRKSARALFASKG